MNDQRSQPRISDAELVMICWDENGTQLRQLGNVENLSLNGASIVVDHALLVGTSVAITYGEGKLTAVVRHCASLAEGHLIGVEFVGNSRDSVLHFQPDLLVWAMEEEVEKSSSW